MTSELKPNPVIFIHGMWVHATAWQPWLELFESRGYSVSAPGWPGTHRRSARPASTPRP